MKKYIRTKDGIYQVRKPALDEYLWEDSTYVYSHEHIDNKDIIKRADSIEELCDEFVGISDGESQMLRFVPYACAQYWNGGVYGAIWTDKGLIYVAKINDKGELELL